MKTSEQIRPRPPAGKSRRPPDPRNQSPYLPVPVEIWAFISYYKSIVGMEHGTNVSFPSGPLPCA